MPNWAQWLGLIATLAGTWLALLAWRSAKRAARDARDAEEQASLAKEAAIRLGRIAQLGDLINDMQELQAMLARKDFAAIASKCGNLRGRIVRFKVEAYTDLGDEESASLDLAREQLEIIGKVAAVGKGTDDNRSGRIQLGYSAANEAINRVFALWRRSAEGD
jgi:hypothetical protein